MPRGDVKSHHVRSSGGRTRRSSRSAYRSSSSRHSTPYVPLSAAEQAALDAKYAEMRLKRQQEELEELSLKQAESVRLTGFLHSEIAQAIAVREKVDLPEGDWLDDPVAAVQGKPGFAEEYNVKQGIRLHINLCLDCSNSMIYNRTARVAVAATYTLYAMLDNVRERLPEGTLDVSVWQFAKYKEGTGVTCMTNRDYYNDNKLLTKQQRTIEAISKVGMDGEDTYIAPLFRSLYNWEQGAGWTGEARLDIILTDGVLEHKKDRKEASDWQLKRDGGLSTVLLNFLPMKEWAEVYLPDHCFQYEASVDNVFTLMTKVLGEWIMLV